MPGQFGSPAERERGVAGRASALEGGAPAVTEVPYALTTQVPAMRSNQPRLRLSTSTQRNPM